MAGRAILGKEMTTSAKGSVKKGGVGGVESGKGRVEMNKKVASLKKSS